MFHLQAGAWVAGLGRTYASNKQGLPDAKLGWFFFPEVHGGKGKANDIFGSVYGWLVSKDAPKEVIHFMKVWLGKDVQTKLAAEGLSIPMVKGTADAKSRILFTKPLLWRWIIRAGFAWRWISSLGARRVASLTTKLRLSLPAPSLRNRLRN